MDIKSKNVVVVDISTINSNPQNANRHSIEQIERLEKLITYQGFRNPLIVSNRTNMLVAGHGRLEAALNLGMKQLPVDFQDFDSEEEEYAYLISDNEIARWAELDFQSVYDNLKHLDIEDVDLLGIEDFKVPEIDVLDPQADEDAVPEVQNPITVRGDIWLLGNHRLMCGDSTMIDDVDKLMDGKKADMVFTDPPYGIGIDGQKKTVAKNPKHSRKEHAFEGWDREIPSEDFWQILHGLNIPSIVFGANYMTEFLPPSRGWIFWGKGQDGQLTSSDGELAWSNLDKPLRVITCNRANIGKSVHPTQKPVKVVLFCLDFVENSSSVIDFFGGSGSTLMACEESKRTNYSLELSEKYCDVIINRWQNYTGKIATLEDSGQTYEELAKERL